MSRTRLSRTTQRDDGAAAVLLHPVVLASLAVWIANDHWAKAAYPGWTTGKLSDVAGLIAFPLLPIAAYSLWRRAWPPRGWIVGWLVGTGAVFAAINVSAHCAELYAYALGALQWPARALLAGELVSFAPVATTRDPTDLLALPALAIPFVLVESRRSGARPADVR